MEGWYNMEHDERMKKNLLVTLADKNYIEQAKQLFSSVYWNAGWKGDYMLLAHNVPENKLKWFGDKGILIKKCKPVFRGKRLGCWPITVSSKFYLFTQEFKKWKNIIYLDGDIIVRGSLDNLTKIKGLAVRNCDIFGKYFKKPESIMLDSRSARKNMELFNELKKNYDFEWRGFSSGVMAFSTDIIKRDTFSKLRKSLKLYNKVNIYGEQTIFNLFFYKKRELLPLGFVYNYWDINYFMYSCNIKPEKIKGTILHFNSIGRPWLPQSPFYNEWKTNLNKAGLINLKNIPPARENLTEEDIAKYFLGLKKAPIAGFFKKIVWKTSFFIREILKFIDKNIGLIGIFLKKHHPRLYFRLKNLKKVFKK